MAVRILHILAAVVFAAALLGAVADGERRAPVPVVGVDWNDSAAATQMFRSLPATMDFTVRFGQALRADLPFALDVASAASATQISAGDIAYWADGPALYLFTVDSEYVPDSGLVVVGTIAEGMDAVDACAPTCTLRFEPTGGRR